MSASVPLDATLVELAAFGFAATLKGWFAASGLSRESTVLDLLLDLPKDIEPAWIADVRLGPAEAAARRQDARDERYERFGEIGDEPTEAIDRSERAVLLQGRYEESPVIEVVRARAAERGDDPDDVLIGRLCLPNGSEISLQRAPSWAHGLNVWVLGRLCAYREDNGRYDYWVHRLQLFEGAHEYPLVRWPRHTRAMSAERMAFMQQLIPEVPWPSLDTIGNDFELFGHVLRGAHCPGSLGDWEAAQAVDVTSTLLLLQSWIVAPVCDAGAPLAVELPMPRLVKTAADAEHYAAEVFRGLGFVDAQATPAGADGGVDVSGADVLAQVKMEALPTGRPVLQSLFGIAALEQKTPTFFSLAGYTAQALEWAQRAGIACFEFAFDGTIEPRTSLADRLLRSGIAGLHESVDA
jgi:hypothetical protein